MRRDPIDPAAFTNLVAAGVYSVFARKPFDVGLAALLLLAQAAWHDVATIARLTRRLDETPGVSSGEVVALVAEPGTAQRALDEVLRLIVAQHHASVIDYSAARVHWDPYIAAVVGARRGDSEMEGMLRELLQVVGAADSSWQHVAEALVLVLDGQEGLARDAAADGIDEALIGRCLNALHGKITIAPELALMTPIGGLLSQMLRAMQQLGESSSNILRANLAVLERSGEWDGLVPLFNALLSGERGHSLGATAAQPVKAAVDLLLEAEILVGPPG